MSVNHVIKRGDSYHFVCRVPCDLLQHFPTKVISRSLKTKDKRHAAALGKAAEYEAQRLYMQLRSGMLDKELENFLVNTFLQRGVKRLDAANTAGAYVRDKESDNPLVNIIDDHAELAFAIRQALEEIAPGFQDTPLEHAIKRRLEQLRIALMQKDSSHSPINIDVLAGQIAKHTGKKLTNEDKQTLGLRFIDAQTQLQEAELAGLSGNWTELRLLRDTVLKALKKPYIGFKGLKTKYLKSYESERKGISRKQLQAVESECDVLLEILGDDAGADYLNSQEALTKLHEALRQYPKTRQHMEGKLSSVLGRGEPIGVDRANKYLKRMGELISFAILSEYTNKQNIYMLKRARLKDKNAVPADKKREQYDAEDLKNLVDALCTKQLSIKGPPKNERFWAVLLTLFTGLRPGNVVTLKKAQIKRIKARDGSEFFALDVLRGKTGSTVKLYAVPMVLELIGFIEWVERQTGDNLFQDTPKQFSAWYNNKQNGFELHVTQDPKKCFYSLRHSYGGGAFAVTEDLQITADLMGHATGKITSRYVKGTKAARLKGLADQVEFEGIDLDRLEERAKELFGL